MPKPLLPHGLAQQLLELLTPVWAYVAEANLVEDVVGRHSSTRVKSPGADPAVPGERVVLVIAGMTPVRLGSCFLSSDDSRPGQSGSQWSAQACMTGGADREARAQ